MGKGLIWKPGNQELGRGHLIRKAGTQEGDKSQLN
jgi:hypothetical protein